MKIHLYYSVLLLLTSSTLIRANESFSVEIEALTLVMEEYKSKLKDHKLSDETKPNYMAFKQDECNATVKVTEKTGLQITALESFEVNVCKKKVRKR